MILDPNGIAKALGASGAASPRGRRRERRPRAPRRASRRPRCWCSAPAPTQPKAVPLALVTRLEEIAADKIELSNGRYMVQYREQLMPLVQIDGVSVQTRARSRSWCSPTTAARWGSWSTRSSTSSRSGSTSRSPAPRTGILGSAVIKGQATEVIDVGHFLPMAFADWFTRKEMTPVGHRAIGAAGRRLARSSATCWRRC